MMRFIAVFYLLLGVLNTNAQKHAEILEQSTHYDIQEAGKAEITEITTIKIHSEQGKYFSYFRGYQDQFRNVRKVSIDIIGKDGKRVKRLSKKDGHEFGFNPSYEISDGKILVIGHDYQQYPFTVNIETVTSLDGFISLPTWIPRYTYNLAVNQATLKITYPKDMQLRLREESIKGKQESKKYYDQISYSVTDLPHVNKNTRYQDFYDNQPKVRISPLSFELDGYEGSFENWQSFGDWFLTLNNLEFEPSDETLDYINSLDRSDTLSLITKLYNYMQDKTRYISIQLGIGGFQSLPSEDVEEYGYGDCKALSTYMKNLLALVDIESNYILVRAGKEVPDVIKDFPSNQFNHVFIGVPLENDTIFLECTSQLNPVNYIGTFTDDRNLLWIEENSSSIIRSKKYSSDVNLKTTKINIDLEESGNALVKIEASNSGVFFDELNLLKSAPQDYVNKKNIEKFQFKDFTIKDFNYNLPSRKTPSYTSSYEISVNRYAEKLNDRLIVPCASSYDLEKFIDYSNLKKYASIKRGFTYEETTTVELSGYCSSTHLPESIEEKSKFGSYSLQVTCDGEKLKIFRRLKMESGDYTNTDFIEFKEFYEAIKHGESQKAILNIKT